MSEELKLQRTREQWAKCEPKLMAQQSQAAVMYALQDAKRDIDALHRHADKISAELAAIKAGQGEAVALSVWCKSMPESNGKSNYTAILHRKGECISEGITLDRSEYPDRVRYEADRARFLIGELNEEPCILDYDADKRSDYTAPPATGVIVPKSRFNNYEITLMINDLDHAEYSDITAALREYAELRALLAQSQEVKS